MIRLGAFRLYGATLLCGLKLIMRGMAVDGIKTLIAPVGYWRFLPNSFVLHEFKKLPPNARILDVSSPKMMSIYLAGRNCSLVATDLDDERIFSRWKKIAEAQRLDNYTVEYQDATALAYPDQSFDMLYSISVIEHIPGRGDVAAMREFARVTKPGGVVVVEVPYRRKNAEVWRKTDTKGAPIPEPRFYERHYDAAMVDERLLHVAGLRLESQVILGEWLPVDPFISGDQLPKLLRMAVLPFEPWLAAVNFWAHSDDKSGRPLAALMVYRKV